MEKNYNTELNNVIELEKVLANCFAYLINFIKNGRIRSRFQRIIKDAHENIVFLKTIAQEKVIIIKPFEHCKFCKISPESFSLLGLIILAMELIKNLEIIYQKILKLVEKKYLVVIKKIILKRKKDLKFLKKEKSYWKEREVLSKIIKEYCLPQINNLLK